ncbi:MAG: CRTAC1 family protein [Chloroflexota bacterium]|nr:CRTAC1 family protein [Chloroflexota bacterium]
MFTDRTQLIRRNPPQLSYGIAVADVDGDGKFEAFITGFAGFPNVVLKWMGESFVNIAPPPLADPARQAIGVAACDIDSDGSEELYILNTDSFAGAKRFADRLFDRVDGQWTDLFSLPINRSVLNLTAGRSVACVDRNGSGQYGFFIANYGGPMRLYELDEDGILRDMAKAARLDYVTGGRSVVALPLLTPRMDIFAGNEGGANFLFRNAGDGTFDEIAIEMGLADPFENARGISVLDGNGDGLFDIVIGNWEGAHRLYYQQVNGPFRNAAPREMAIPSRVRTVIAADFDNDGYEEIFFNNIGEPNRLFAQRDGHWEAISPGEAMEPNGLGTGAAIADFDDDGRLELLIAHGESGMQPLSYYHAPYNDNHFLRVMPLTQHGAPARGAIVRLITPERTQIRAIDAGSGYLCQMEPVAHFGLGQTTTVTRIEVQWLDGTLLTLDNPAIDTLHEIAHPTG